MTGTEIIAAGLGLAGNTSLSATLALDALNRGLDKLYRKKFGWQRLTASVVFTAGVAYNTAQWPSTFLDLYEHFDGSVGRYTDPQNNITSPTALAYRQYINVADRLTATGQPRFISYDEIAGRWYVYPLGDITRTIDIDYYQKPAAIAAAGTPLWSSYASDDILVNIVKAWGLYWQDDNRFQAAMAEIVGEVGAYRRKDQAKEGIVHQSALDPRIFRTALGYDD